MIVTQEQIVGGLIRYIDNDLGAKATGLTKFMIYFIAPSLPNIVNQKLLDFKNAGIFNDMFNEAGNVNIDIVHDRAVEAIRKSGKLYINGIGYFMDEGDIDVIYNYIRNS